MNKWISKIKNNIFYIISVLILINSFLYVWYSSWLAVITSILILIGCYIFRNNIIETIKNIFDVQFTNNKYSNDFLKRELMFIVVYFLVTIFLLTSVNIKYLLTVSQTSITIFTLLFVTIIDSIFESYIFRKEKSMKYDDYDNKYKADTRGIKIYGGVIAVIMSIICIATSLLTDYESERETIIDDNKTNIEFTDSKNQKETKVNTETSYIQLKNGKKYKLVEEKNK